jgi:hypothetical protein
MAEVIDVSKKKSKLKLILLISIPLLIILAIFYFFIFDLIRTAPQQTNQQIQQAQQDIQMQNLTPSVISYLLNQIGASGLHKNTFTREKPTICVKVEGKEYYSVIDGGINTKDVSCTNQDIDIVSSKQEVLNVVLSSDPKTAVKDSVSSGKTQLKVIASQTNLFAKGYLSLYNSLKS